jgi:hypothetical protein
MGCAAPPPPPVEPVSAAVPSTGPADFALDIENHSHRGVVVSVASDTAATMAGFEPGQRGTISIALGTAQNGISVEIQGPGCTTLAHGRYPTAAQFTLVIDDRLASDGIVLSERAGTSGPSLGLPANSLVGCGG